ncbi:MAG: cell wall-active antibiotics response protein [bacterium]|nr:cell wall-active antibiotics response protein [bacterium]
MSVKVRDILNTRVILGLLVMAAGVILLLPSFGVEVSFRLWDFWPLVLIAMGVVKLLEPRGLRHPMVPLLLIVVGNLFLLSNLGYISFRFVDLWPVLLIFVGFSLLKGRGSVSRCRRSFGGGELDSDFIELNTVLGGGNYRYIAKNLKGGKAMTFMGGGEIDLRQAEMEGDSIEFSVQITMGGLEIQIPDHWQVVIESTALLGAIEDKTTSSVPPTKRLIVSGSVLMGGVEFKN